MTEGRMDAATCVPYTYLRLVKEDRPLGGIRNKTGISEHSVCTAGVYRGRWEGAHGDPSYVSTSALWDASQENACGYLFRKAGSRAQLTLRLDLVALEEERGKEQGVEYDEELGHM